MSKRRKKTVFFGWNRISIAFQRRENRDGRQKSLRLPQNGSMSWKVLFFFLLFSLLSIPFRFPFFLKQYTIKRLSLLLFMFFPILFTRKIHDSFLVWSTYPVVICKKKKSKKEKKLFLWKSVGFVSTSIYLIQFDKEWTI